MSAQHPTSRRWFNTEEAAEYLGMTVRQVVRARQTCKLGYTRLGGNLARHTQAQLDAYVEACTVAPTTDAK